MALEDSRSISALMSGAISQASSLVRTEFNLARAEAVQKLAIVRVGVGLIAGAGLVSMAALVLLLMALAAELTQYGVPEALSDALVGILGLVASGVLATFGLGQVRANALKPTHTIEQLRRDADAVKEHAR